MNKILDISTTHLTEANLSQEQVYTAKCTTQQLQNISPMAISGEFIRIRGNNPFALKSVFNTRHSMSETLKATIE